MLGFFVAFDFNKVKKTLRSLLSKHIMHLMNFDSELGTEFSKTFQVNFQCAEMTQIKMWVHGMQTKEMSLQMRQKNQACIENYLLIT